MDGKEVLSERKIERRLSREVRKAGGMPIKLLPYVLAGIPDRLCLFQGGRIAFVELKTYKESASERQKHFHARLRNLGFDVRIINSYESVAKLIEDYAQKGTTTPDATIRGRMDPEE